MVTGVKILVRRWLCMTSKLDKLQLYQVHNLLSPYFVQIAANRPASSISYVWIMMQSEVNSVNSTQIWISTVSVMATDNTLSTVEYNISVFVIVLFYMP